MSTFTITRPLNFKQYDASESVVDVDHQVTLTTTQLHSLRDEFVRFALNWYNDDEDEPTPCPNVAVKAVDVVLTDDELTVTFEAKTPLTDDQLMAIEEEFDRWFVEGAVEDWLFDIVPYKLWLVLCYRPLV